MFDIFKRLPDGNFVWISETQSLDTAKACVERLQKIVPGTYLIHSPSEGLVLEHSRGKYAA
ncbi:MAG: hypothetical protein WCA00_16930 [Candidatus Acidiferrales bacterium]